MTRFGVADPSQGRGVSPQWLSDTIGAIYDCVLQPDRWCPTLEALCSQLSLHSATLAIIRPNAPTHSNLFDVGFDDEWRMQLDEYYIAESIEMWGGSSKLEALPLEEPVVASVAIEQERMRKCRYVVDLLYPRGIVDSVVLPLVREPNLWGYLGVNRHVSVGFMTPDVLDALRLLAPHFRRAATISNLFDVQAISRETFGAVLDAMTCGVVLVDETLHIVHANRSATAMLSRGDVVAATHGKLFVSGRNAGEMLLTAVRTAAANEATMARRGIGIPVQGPDNSVALLHVLPLSRGKVRGGLVARAVAAIFVVPQDNASSTAVDAISQFFELTPTEGLIFASFSKGQSLAQTAEALGIATATVRTHLHRIFEKTGCKRQAELVALAARYSLTT